MTDIAAAAEALVAREAAGPRSLRSSPAIYATTCPNSAGTARVAVKHMRMASTVACLRCQTHRPEAITAACRAARCEVNPRLPHSHRGVTHERTSTTASMPLLGRRTQRLRGRSHRSLRVDARDQSHRTRREDCEVTRSTQFSLTRCRRMLWSMMASKG
jgi:hypothetical protein